MPLALLRRTLLIFAIVALFPASADDAGKVRDLAWMAGEWSSQEDGAGSELIEQAPGRAVFANPEHDWPKRITYWLEKDGRRLCSEVGGNAGDRTAKWCWDRVDPS